MNLPHQSTKKEAINLPSKEACRYQNEIKTKIGNVKI